MTIAPDISLTVSRYTRGAIRKQLIWPDVAYTDMMISNNFVGLLYSHRRFCNYLGDIIL